YLPQAKKYFATGNSPQSRAAANSMWTYRDFFAKGFEYTLIISAVSIILGVVLGLILALMRLSHNKFFRIISVSYIEFVRGTPLMAQVLFIYFGLGFLVDLPTLLSGIIAISLNAAAYIAEVIRSGINSIPIGQSEAAYSLGMSAHATMRFVILPQALKNIWPALGNQLISLVKDSSLASVIGVSELIYQSRIIQADTFRGMMPLVVVMFLYFAVTFSISKVMQQYEQKLAH
ncbi:amino acid ABC transporter permease, partial [Lactobacillus sp. XV13L]|nr:amino acid ABC transporter permease [Lactobacillus sp. XV13L]